MACGNGDLRENLYISVMVPAFCLGKVLYAAFGVA